jgi:hypothetical protein
LKVEGLGSSGQVTSTIPFSFPPPKHRHVVARIGIRTTK